MEPDIWAQQETAVLDQVGNRLKAVFLADGKRTEMVVTIHTDPMGMMPVWLVNMIQKSWPVKTLNGIRTQLQQPYTKNFPLPSSVKAEPEPEPVEEPEPAEEAAPAEEASAVPDATEAGTEE